MKDHRHASLNIKSVEAHSIAVRLAKLQGTTISAAVIQALRAELRRQQRRVHPADRLRVWKHFLAAYRAYRCWITVPRMRFLAMAGAATRMVIDTSAMLAMLFEEGIAPRLRRAGRR